MLVDEELHELTHLGDVLLEVFEVYLLDGALQLGESQLVRKLKQVPTIQTLN